MKFLNNLKTTPETFDVEAFNEIVNSIKRTQRVILSMDEDRTEIQTKLDTAKANLQKAVDAIEYDDIQKYTAEAKRLQAKLGEDPALKAQDFDEAINKLMVFCQPKASKPQNENLKAVA